MCSLILQKDKTQDQGKCHSDLTSLINSDLTGFMWDMGEVADDRDSTAEKFWTITEETDHECLYAVNIMKHVKLVLVQSGTGSIWTWFGPGLVLVQFGVNGAAHSCGF